MSAGKRRWVIANLDWERELVETSPALSEKVLEKISCLGTLLRALCREGDRVWTPRPVDPRRVVSHPGLPTADLISGPLPEGPFDSLLAWGESPGVAALRGEPSQSSDPKDSIVDALWALPPSPVESVRRANDRAFLLEAARQLEIALPGSRLVESTAELETHLATWLETHGKISSGQWILKAPFSSAGRWRHRGQGPLPGDARSRNAVRHLFEHFGFLLFEPWMDRVDDFALSAIVTPKTVRQLSFHRQSVDGYGRFHGLLCPVDGKAMPWLRECERDSMQRTLEGVAQRLRAVGYAGPVTIDCWRYRGPGGEELLHPLGEINARMSFGLIVRAWMERLCESGALSETRAVRLAMHDGSIPEGADVIPLLLSTPENPFSIWLQTIPNPREGEAPSEPSKR